MNSTQRCRGKFLAGNRDTTSANKDRSDRVARKGDVLTVKAKIEIFSLDAPFRIESIFPATTDCVAESIFLAMKNDRGGGVEYVGLELP